MPCTVPSLSPKDIKDELDILTSVLRQQGQVLSDLSALLRVSKKIARSQQSGLFNKADEHELLVDLDILYLDRMARQAKSGRTIMVFNIVTTVFLPLSFLTSFFAIDIIEFPRPAGSGPGELHLGWVLQRRFMRRRKRLAPWYDNESSTGLPSSSHSALDELDARKESVIEETRALRRINSNSTQHISMQPSTMVPAQIQAGQQPVSSRRTGTRFPRRLRQIGTEMTGRSAETEDLEVNNGYGL
ncbi:uncharacterized protein PV07_09893 [Cladophialophora immunda]|uniref:Uncharacterized protein n=1 Tax=Cladophialophora immunda TaxID=569365 RepID=A0A0D2BYG3_9EURO|nr:uncharacterized protein PV07_09893 [Cladophialophora immunda]KIW24163.1 hypothetical protein PV07_09893 [Cladophialophora immunda]